MQTIVDHQLYQILKSEAPVTKTVDGREVTGWEYKLVVKGHEYIEKTFFSFENAYDKEAIGVLVSYIGFLGRNLVAIEVINRLNSH